MSNLSSLKAARDQAQENIDTYNYKIDNLKEDNLSKQEIIDGFQESNLKLTNENKNLESEISQLNISKTTFEDTQNEEEIKKINKEIENKTKQINSNKSRIESNNKEIEKNSNEIDENNQNIQNVNDAKKNLGYTEEDLKNLDELMEEMKLHEQNPVSKYNISSITGSDAGVHPDIRNLPGAMNFRSYASKYTNSLQKLAAVEYSAAAEKTSLARSFYMNQDFLFTNSLASPIPLGKVAHDTMPEIQPLIINEFQPYEMLQFKDVFDGLAGWIDKITGLSNSDGGVLAPIINGMKVHFANKAIDNAYKNTDKLYLHGSRIDREYFTSDPVKVVENMFGGGKWLNTYEIPFYGSEYLIAKYSDDWTVGNGEDAIGKTFSTFFGADFPANPKFKTTMAKSRRPTIETKFYLINANSEWMRRNFEFIQAIFAGTSWVHLKYCRLRPPNVYNVVCPGRFHMIYATMDITVTFEGKLRKNPKFSNSLRSMGIYSVDEDTLWPDAWKIELSIHDLTPNNFNMYANYYMNGFNINEMATLANKNDVMTALSHIPEYVSDFWSTILDSDAAEKVKNWVNENITPKINALKDKAANATNTIKDTLTNKQSSNSKQGFVPEQTSETSSSSNKYDQRPRETYPSTPAHSGEGNEFFEQSSDND